MQLLTGLLAVIRNVQALERENKPQKKIEMCLTIITPQHRESSIPGGDRNYKESKALGNNTHEFVIVTTAKQVMG